jgi:hypothetical protein
MGTLNGPEKLSNTLKAAINIEFFLTLRTSVFSVLKWPVEIEGWMQQAWNVASSWIIQRCYINCAG